MPLWTVIYVVLFWLWLVHLVVACVRWGDAPVRWAALSLLGVMVCQRVTRLGIAVSYRSIALPTVALDMTLLALLGIIAVRYPRWWVIALASVQLITCLGHVAKLLDPRITRLTYALLIGSGGYPALILLSFGLIGSIRSRSTPMYRRA